MPPALLPAYHLPEPSSTERAKLGFVPNIRLNSVTPHEARPPSIIAPHHAQPAGVASTRLHADNPKRQTKCRSVLAAF